MCSGNLNGPPCFNMFGSGLLNLGTADIWGKISLCCGASPVHCRMFSSTPGLYTWHASSTTHTPVVTTKNVCRHCQICPHSFTFTKMPLGPLSCFIKWCVREARIFCSAFTVKVIEGQEGKVLAQVKQ